ncbi:hypothetical protein LWM68_35640 [Niabella sp. W65]|nr:hypothetical protein [Niabella sp. W65]MCH7367625.1 hypothetical protein [Niabella sp. W65]
MKKFIFAALVIAGFSLVQNANAQVRININIGNQPAWGPVGYDYARYYYLPEYNAYYDVMGEQFIYPNRRGWAYGRSLPASYGRVNLYNTYKVVVNRNYEPYRDNRRDIQNYSRYRNTRDQLVVFATAASTNITKAGIIPSIKSGTMAAIIITATETGSMYEEVADNLEIE